MEAPQPTNEDIQKETHAFELKDCALAAISTGRTAQNLRELGNELKTIHPGSIYYHFWAGLLRPRFVDPQFHNDFAIWAQYSLRDQVLAERLGIIDPTGFKNLEELRRELVDLIEMRLDESEWVPWARTGDQFIFLRSQIVVFDSGRRVGHPRELAKMLPSMPVESIFYHFIDARRREPIGIDDFNSWIISEFPEYAKLCRELDKVYPFFSNLIELRKKLVAIFQNCCEK